MKDFGRLIGILTERDMLRAMAARVHTSDARVRQWMTADPSRRTPDMTFDDAQQIMLDNGFRHLPVVDGADRPRDREPPPRLGGVAGQRPPPESGLVPRRPTRRPVTAVAAAAALTASSRAAP